MVQRNTTGFNCGDKLTQRPTVLVLFQVIFEVNFLIVPSLSGLAKGNYFRFLQMALCPNCCLIKFNN